MHEDFWRQRWEENQIGFHEGQPNAYLQRFVEHLRVQAEPRVLVPLCGKAVDLRWLAEHGFRVTGVELVPWAAQAFFDENGWAVVSERDGGLPCLASERVRIAVGDFFHWDPAQSAPVDVVYDRAALVAVKPEDRERYAAHLLSALRPGGRILLVSFAYEQEVMSGPPFSVPEEEARRCFGERCRITRLAEEDILDREPRFRERGLGWLKEQAWLLEVS